MEFIVHKGLSEIALRLPGSVVNALAGLPYAFKVHQPARTKPPQPVYLWRFSDGPKEIRTEKDQQPHTFVSPGQYYLGVFMYDKKTGKRLGQGGTMILVSPGGMSDKERDLLNQRQAALEGAYLEAIGKYPGSGLDEKFQAYARENRQKTAASLTPAGEIDYESMVRKTLEDMKQKYREENNGAEIPAAQLQMLEKVIRQQVGSVKQTFTPPPGQSLQTR